MSCVLTPNAERTDLFLNAQKRAHYDKFANIKNLDRIGKLYTMGSGGRKKGRDFKALHTLENTWNLRLS